MGDVMPWAVQTSPTTINVECMAYLFRDIWEATEPKVKLTFKEPTRVGNVFFLEALDSNDLTGIDHMAYRLWARIGHHAKNRKPFHRSRLVEHGQGKLHP